MTGNKKVIHIFCVGSKSEYKTKKYYSNNYIHYVVLKGSAQLTISLQSHSHSQMCRLIVAICNTW